MLALPSLALMAIIHSIADGWEPFIWDGGMALFDIATVIVILSLAMGVFPVTALFTHDGMAWIGKISYGLYIWQIPVLTLLHRHAPTWNTLVVTTLGVICTILCGALSYYYIEQPIRRSRFVSQLAGHRLV